MRSFLPSVALVTAAFLLGCQEQASNPVGPEGLGPQFTHKEGGKDKGTPGGNTGDPLTFTVTVSGKISGGPKDGTGARNSRSTPSPVQPF